MKGCHGQRSLHRASFLLIRSPRYTAHGTHTAAVVPFSPQTSPCPHGKHSTQECPAPSGFPGPNRPVDQTALVSSHLRRRASRLLTSICGGGPVVSVTPSAEFERRATPAGEGRSHASPRRLPRCRRHPLITTGPSRRVTARHTAVTVRRLELSCHSIRSEAVPWPVVVGWCRVGSRQQWVLQCPVAGSGSEKC